MLQVGCASASLGRDVARARARLRPRNGPPEAVRTSESTWSGVLPSRHWKSRGVLAVDRAGAALRPARCAASASSPAATRLSLLASASVDAALERPESRPAAGKADDGVEDEVGLGAPRAARSGSPPPWKCSTPSSAASPVRSRRPGRERAELELGVRVDDLERLAADRAGGAEESDPLHAGSLRARAFDAPHVRVTPWRSPYDAALTEAGARANARSVLLKTTAKATST